MPISGSFILSRSSASSSSRNARSGQNWSPAARIASGSVGSAASGARDRERRRLACRRSMSSATRRSTATRRRSICRVERVRARSPDRWPADRTPPQVPRARLATRSLELARRIHRVDQPPLDRPLALHALRRPWRRRPPDRGGPSLVHDAGQAAGAGQHAEQRRLRQADRGVPVVDEEDLVAGQRELVAAAGADAVQRREELQAGVRAGVFDREPRLVRELAEVHLPGVRRRRAA